MYPVLLMRFLYFIVAVFFIPYCIMLFFVGMPMFALEVSFGQYTSKGPVGAWECCRLFSGGKQNRN